MNRRLWAVLIVILGLWLMFFFGTRTLRAYREFEYAREQGLLNGTASVEAIQPWMTIRYIAVAYAVPEEYIYAKLEIPFDRRLAHAPLGRLARQRPPDEAAGAEERSQVPAPPDSPKEFDAFLARVRSVILAYRENPVAPGLRDIRPWMSLAYIANSTGVPIEYLLQEVAAAAQTALATERAAREPADQESASETELGAEVDTDENRHKPLDLLSGDLHYPGGPEQLLDVVRMALTNYEEAPAQE